MGMDTSKNRAPLAAFGRAASSTRPFREVVERVGRDERQRVVPLPLTFAAILLPFLAAWATAGPEQDVLPSATAPASAREVPESLWVLGRASRIPADPDGYVDLYGPPKAWEAELLTRRGYRSASASAEYGPHAGDQRRQRGERAASR